MSWLSPWKKVATTIARVKCSPGEGEEVPQEVQMHHLWTSPGVVTPPAAYDGTSLGLMICSKKSFLLREPQIAEPGHSEPCVDESASKLLPGTVIDLQVSSIAKERDEEEAVAS